VETKLYLLDLVLFVVLFYSMVWLILSDVVIPVQHFLIFVHFFAPHAIAESELFICRESPAESTVVVELGVEDHREVELLHFFIESFRKHSVFLSVPSFDTLEQQNLFGILLKVVPERLIEPLNDRVVVFVDEMLIGFEILFIDLLGELNADGVVIRSASCKVCVQCLILARIVHVVKIGVENLSDQDAARNKDQAHCPFNSHLLAGSRTSILHKNNGSVKVTLVDYLFFHSRF
jgi:hypothetical protein